MKKQTLFFIVTVIVFLLFVFGCSKPKCEGCSVTTVTYLDTTFISTVTKSTACGAKFNGTVVRQIEGYTITQTMKCW